MKTLTALILIAIGTAAAVVPAYARTHCYYLDGRMICCTEGRTVTTCY